MASKASAAQKPAAPVAVQAPPQNTALVLVQNGIAEMGRVAAGLAEMEKRYAGIVYDVKNPEGMARAKADRKAVRDPIYAIENIRKVTKRPLLDLTTQLDGEARRLTTALRALEANSDGQITAEEERVENERQAKVDAELKRVDDIRYRIATIRGYPARAVGQTATAIDDLIDRLSAGAVTEADFAEFTQEATDAHTAALSALREAHKRQSDHEAEAERVRVESEALAVRQRELAEAETKARKEREAREIEDARRRQDEQRRLDARAADLKRQEEALERSKREETEARARREREATVPPAAASAPVAAHESEPPASYNVGHESDAAPATPEPTATEIVRVVADHFGLDDNATAAFLSGVDFSKAECR